MTVRAGTRWLRLVIVVQLATWGIGADVRASSAPRFVLSLALDVGPARILLAAGQVSHL